MKNLIVSEFTLLKQNNKIKFLLLFFLIFSLGVSFFVSSQNIGDLQKEKIEILKNIASPIQLIPEKERIDKDLNEKYNLLVTQEQLISTQVMALIMEDNDLYLSYEKDYLDNQLTLHDHQLFQEKANFLLNPYEIKNQLAINQYLTKNHLKVATTFRTGSGVLTLFLKLLASFLAIWIFLFCCDILLDDFRRPSIIRTMPLSLTKRIFVKLFCYVLIMLTATILAMIIAFAHSSWRFEKGNFYYPIPIFLSKATVLPLTTFCTVFIGYLVCLFVFIISLSIGLNMLTKNLYWTFSIELILWCLPQLFPKISHFLPFLPSNYLNGQAVLSGKLAFLANNPQINFSNGLLSLSISSVILLLFILFVHKMKGAK